MTLEPGCCPVLSFALPSLSVTAECQVLELDDADESRRADPDGARDAIAVAAGTDDADESRKADGAMDAMASGPSFAVLRLLEEQT